MNIRPMLGAMLTAFSLALAPVAAPIDAQRASARTPITVRWLGHAAFEITSSGGTTLLIDPFLSGNPITPDSLKNLGR